MSKNIYGNYVAIPTSSGSGSFNPVITSPVNNQALIYNGTNWVNTNIVNSFNSRTGHVIPLANDHNISQIQNSSILADSANVNISAPTNNQILKYIGGQWTNSNQSEYNLVYTFSSSPIAAVPFTYYVPSFGATITITGNPGERFKVTALSNNVTINFGGTSFIVNSDFSGSISNPVLNLLWATIELECIQNVGQNYYNILTVSQNNKNSIFTMTSGINSSKICALSKIADIPDVNISSPILNQLLAFDGINWINSTFSVFGRTGTIVAQDGDYNLDQLGDVILTAPANGQILSYNGTNWINSTPSSGVTSVFGRTGTVIAQEGDYILNQLGDVTITTPTIRQSLVYNGTNWVNGAESWKVGGNSIPDFLDKTFGTITQNTLNIVANNTTRIILQDAVNAVGIFVPGPLCHLDVGGALKSAGFTSSVSSTRYTTGTISQSGFTVTGVLTNFTNSMIGSLLVYSVDGLGPSSVLFCAGIITSVASPTSLTVTKSLNQPTIGFYGIFINGTGCDDIGNFSTQNIYLRGTLRDQNNSLGTTNQFLGQNGIYGDLPVASLAQNGVVSTTTQDFLGLKNFQNIFSTTSTFTNTTVNGAFNLNAQLFDRNGSIGSTGNVLKNFGGQVEWGAASGASFYNSSGLISSPKVFVGSATTNGGSIYSVNISAAGFTTVYSASANAIGGTNATNVPIATIQTLNTTTISGLVVESNTIFSFGDGLSNAGSGITVYVKVIGI